MPLVHPRMQDGTSSYAIAAVAGVLMALVAFAGAFAFSLHYLLAARVLMAFLRAAFEGAFAFWEKAPSANTAPCAAAAKVHRGQSPGRKPEQPGAVEAAPDEAPEPHVNSALAGMSEEEVEAWLSKLGHPDAAKRFREGAISGDVLADLTDTDLENMGVAPIGERKKVLALVKAGLKSGPEAAAARSRATQRKPSGRHGQSPRR
jgi:hypothetical protein